MSDFVEYPKIARLNRDIVITEKIDGTNAQILIGPRLRSAPVDYELALVHTREGCTETEESKVLAVYAGSRNRWLRPGEGREAQNDNYGFAAWVAENAAELVTLLSPGRHFGEWWGAGIQRRYGLTAKRFSLFNVHKYAEVHAEIGGVEIAPVPLLYRGPWFIPLPDGDDIRVLHPGGGRWAPEYQLERLQRYGSVAAPGFMDPEGIVIFHEASGHLYKATIKDDEKPKGVR